ncbi:glycoside hydrolase family 3 C-terminal domain-containing protein [Flavobacterium sp. HJJ]|uniref:glycoside hydrolase family 3 C-terminal domain-containing protein n=1 Tax=Flavobacterium sp. HJJ TaxID=2783792 RepID=UPI00188C5209|nr:glycoside hydrolase family 3 C-terminal domain-containing protein [Flavobacterium sp. HJJ]MBF4470465.1 glycoside hydrolase family 3 C-terminal domain-containing protein [Flavobacterium sp. HJJ]
MGKNRWGAKTYELAVKKDSHYTLAVEYWQGEGSAYIKMNAGSYVKTDYNQLADRFKDADAFIFTGGISPQLEGEEMKVSDPGFDGGDRTSIQLPTVQTELMKALKSTGKPVIFVMMTGSAIAAPWESENIPAILNAWYGGQSAGTAVADILFGDYNPSGRLPVTFYRGDSDLASFNDYNMENRTYRYFKGVPQYGFGFGLSYTSFKYSKLKIPVQAEKNKNVSVSVTITNTGKFSGEEVAQLYVLEQSKKIKTAIKALKGFERVSLNPGQSKTITFTLTPQDLSYVTAEGKLQQLNGKIEIAVGGHQPDEHNLSSSGLIKSAVTIK